MQILIVTAVFPPESVVSAQTSAQIAEDLVKEGHQVSVIAPFPSRPSGKLYPGYSRRLFSKDNYTDAIKVQRCFSTLSRESRLASRFFENISFGITGGLAVLFAKKPDVIYSNNWALFASGLLAFIAHLRHIPLLLCIQDIYPEQLIAQGRLQREGWIVRLLQEIDRKIANSACSIIVISESLAEIYRDSRNVPHERVHVITNWANSDSIIPNDPAAILYRQKRAIDKRAFVVMYGGNIAFAAGVEVLILSFEMLRDLRDTYLIIAGEGNQLESCKRISIDVGNSRIYFHTPWPRSENSMLLSAADLLVLPTRGEVSLVSMPSKLISYMLAARPIVALAPPNSDLAYVIGRAGCGWVIEPDKPELLAAKIREVRELPPQVREQMGQSGRQYALANFTREACVPRIIQLLENFGLWTNP